MENTWPLFGTDLKSALQISLLLLIAFIAAFGLYKIRRVHLATYQLLENTARTRRETESLFAQMQTLLALERLLGMPKALPAMRGWAGSPDFLLRAAEEIIARKPMAVMECSSGVSTLVSARALQINGAGHVYSLEHDPVYAEKTRAMLQVYNLNEWATIFDAPLVKHDTSSTPWYSLEAIPADIPPIEILIVDGPPMTTGPLARYPALPRLIDRFAERVTIIIDDASRDDEQTMLSRWQQEYSEFKQFDAFCEKGCVIVERNGEEKLCG